MVLNWASDSKGSDTLVYVYVFQASVTQWVGREAPKQGCSSVFREQGTVGMARDRHGVSQKYRLSWEARCFFSVTCALPVWLTVTCV